MKPRHRSLPEVPMTRYLPLVVAVVLSAGGCGKGDDPRTVASPQSAIKPGESREAPVPVPPLPEVNVAKGAEGQLPKPGQANDHSSPAFKGGGAPDKK